LRDVVAAVRDISAGGPVTLVSYGPDRPRGRFGGARLEHHGFVDQARLAALYRSASVCVSASWYESFPLPPLEAMAVGVPTICTRLGTEDYAADGENALIVPPQDPNAIAAALRRVRDDPDLCERLVRNGLDTARRFTWKRAEDLFVDHCERAVTV
jgi:glycosyltransferase involved in cell wall biosynthesis